MQQPHLFHISLNVNISKSGEYHYVLIAGYTSAIIAFKSLIRCRIAELTDTFLGQSFMLKPPLPLHVISQTYRLSDGYKWLWTGLSSLFVFFFCLSIILSPTPLSLSFFLSFLNLSIYLPDHLPIPLVASLPPLSPSPTSLLSSISLTSPELWGIQDRQVAVVTGRAGIFYFFFFFKE